MGHKQVGLALGCLLSVLLWSLGPIGGSDTITAMAAVAVLMSVFLDYRSDPVSSNRINTLGCLPVNGYLYQSSGCRTIYEFNSFFVDWGVHDCFSHGALEST